MWIGLGLVLITALVYFPVGDFDFVNFDDGSYVADNPHVYSGLRLDNAVWAFTNVRWMHWFPITWLAQMAVCEMSGLDAGAHHCVNLLFHALNVLLLICVMVRMTDAPVKSGCVAALFALHPLNVESVAWVSELSNVLSLFWGLIAMAAYVWYARRASLRKYLWVVLFYAMALMAKPQVVTWPFVFLLLDFWPLGRMVSWSVTGLPSGARRPSAAANFKALLGGRVFWRLALEKLPLVCMALVSCGVTIASQWNINALMGLEELSLSVRVGNALISCVTYIEKMFWPVHCAIFYPYPHGGIHWWNVSLSALFLLGVTVWVVRGAFSRPYLAVGWLWYLGTLLPMSGIIQGGSHGMADRYTYVPMIGLFLMGVWGATDFIAARRMPRPVVMVLGAAVGLYFTMISTVQIQYWRDDFSLFGRALEVTSKNWVAHFALGTACAKEGRLDEAEDHYRKALKIVPNEDSIHNSLGAVLDMRGKHDAALKYFNRALELNPRLVSAHYNLALWMIRGGQTKDAMAQFEKILRLDPLHDRAHYHLGRILADHGRWKEATAHFYEALRIKPDFQEAQAALAWLNDVCAKITERREGRHE